MVVVAASRDRRQQPSGVGVSLVCRFENRLLKPLLDVTPGKLGTAVWNFHKVPRSEPHEELAGRGKVEWENPVGVAAVSTSTCNDEPACP